MRPCICGADVELGADWSPKVLVTEPMMNGRVGYLVRCPACKYATGVYRSEDAAVEAWNEENEVDEEDE